MNYQWHYDELIRTRKEKIPLKNVYYENHHIVMKSMGGGNEKENLVMLTAREHFIAHWLLWRIHRNRQSAFAFNCMRRKNSNQILEIKSSRGYQEAREAMSIHVSEMMKHQTGWKGKTQTPAHVQNRMNSIKCLHEKNLEETGRKRKKYSEEAIENIKNAAKNAKRGKKSPMTDATKKKLSEYWKGKSKPEGFGEKISIAKKGKPSLSRGNTGNTHSDEVKKKISARIKENNFIQYQCPHCLAEGIGRSFKGWHFDKCKSRLNMI